jgi:SAM-dependent methyltransferase
MTTTPAVFDPVAYKQTTREQWQTAADAWHRWGPVLHEWLGPATKTMLDMAGVGPGAHVLDVAAGAGEQTVAAARRVGPTGAVVATDISPNILRYCAQEARKMGLANVQTREADAEALDLPEGSFDSVICRLGLMYLPNLKGALEGMRRVLKPGGQMAAIVFAEAEANGFFSLPVSIIRKRAGLGSPLPGQPGPFSLGGPGVLERALGEAGFEEVRVERVGAPLRLETAEECVRLEKESYGALHQMLAKLDKSGREGAWAEVGRELKRFQEREGFVGPCELLVGAGVKPLG